MEALRCVLFVSALVLSAAPILGPFREAFGGEHGLTCPRCEQSEPHSHWIDGWIRGWPQRPRARLTTQDWLPNSGFLFLPWLCALLLLLWGLHELSTKGSTGWGIVSLIGTGIVMCAIAAFLHRPTQPLRQTRKVKK